MERPTVAIRGLYVITDARRRPLAELGRRADAALAGGARILQYRDKTRDAQRRRREAALLRECCRRAGAVFIVNDDVELALAVGADGVHLGRADGSLRRARQRLGPGAVIGVSCYDSLLRAESARADGADYLAFGAVYPSTTKPGASRADLATLREARRRFRLPLVAIGGIDAENVAPLAAAGVDAVAVVNAVFGAGDPQGAAEELVLAIEAGPGSG